MDEQHIYKELTDIFHEVFDDDSLVLKPNLTAKDVPEWDSVTHINIIVAAETRFGIKFKAAELESLLNVGQFVELIGQKLSAK
jgi:acyl carrier protein